MALAPKKQENRRKRQPRCEQEYSEEKKKARA
jgi:hypothetical protein